APPRTMRLALVRIPSRWARETAAFTPEVAPKSSAVTTSVMSAEAIEQDTVCRRGAASPRTSGTRTPRGFFCRAFRAFSLTPRPRRDYESPPPFTSKRSANPFFRESAPYERGFVRLERPARAAFQRRAALLRSEVAEDRCSVASPANARRDHRRQRRAGG